MRQMVSRVASRSGLTLQPVPRPAPTALALFVLASATFVFVTTETQPVALLAPMSAGLGVSESAVGLLMTAYAAVAAITAIPLTVFSSRIPRRALVIATVGLLVVSQAMLALAPSYEVALVARLIGAMAHGVFWSVIAQVAARLVDRERVGRATAIVFAGNSLALVAGIPIVSAIGALVGWRAAVAGMGVVAAATVLAMWLVLPAVGSGEAHIDRREILTLAARTPRLLIVCAVTLFIALGQFVAFTYISPIVRAHTGLTGIGLSVVLLTYGAAGVLGVAVVGAVTDRRPRAAMLACCAAVVAALALLAIVTRSTPATVVAAVAWGAGFTALPICLQTAVLRVAPRVPDTGSALYVVAFQIGIGTGALIGAGLLHAGDLRAIPAVACGCIAVGSLIAAVSASTFGRPEQPNASPHHGRSRARPASQTRRPAEQATRR